jgi:type IV pilus assembly protein PilO
MDIKEFIEQINNIDLAEIRADNIGSWPVGVRIVACILAFVLAAGGYYYFRVMPLNTQLENAHNQEGQLKQDFSSRAFQAANLEAYRLQLQELELRLDTLISQLPSDTEVPGLLEDITETGLGSGLTIESIELQPETAHDYYIELPISIEARGGYHDFATFVSGVAGLPRIVTLHDFTIEPSKDGVQTLSIEAKTYRYRQSPEEGGSL